ncbi:TSCPD domain-containing protein [Falsiroseomonas sp.]|uniref:TSCPD domain-containing protein n=1 Tax=Falsiroseomonas sp. TaxID=2870721 RepID=UPI00356862AB
MSGTVWEGVALGRLRAAPDPDSPARAIALPLAWGEEEAAALAALAPGSGPILLPRLVEGWIGTLRERGRKLGILGDAAEADRFAEALRALLLDRRGAPGAGIWRGETRGQPRFVLNLPAFLDQEGGFDSADYAAAVAIGVRALDIWTGAKAPRLALGFADLAGLLAGLGLAYDSAGGRAAGAAIAALTRGAAEAESGRIAERLGAREPVALLAPSPPAATLVPGLAAAARAALDAAAGCAGLRHQGLVALATPDAVERLLGAESGGLAPASGPSRLMLDRDGWVAELPTRAALRAGPAAERLLAPVPHAAWLAMAQAVAPFLHAAPPLPLAEAAPARPPAPAPAPALAPRPSGAVWRASVGGHRVVLRTTEDAAGQPVELAIALTKEGAAYRSLMEAMMQAVSIGLAAGVPLATYVDAYAYTRFGPAGAVDGDPAIRQATSVLDWAFRKLAREYLGRLDLPDPDEADCAPDAIGRAAEQAPLLPLDLPEAPAPRVRRRQLKLVG